MRPPPWSPRTIPTVCFKCQGFTSKRLSGAEREHGKEKYQKNTLGVMPGNESVLGYSGNAQEEDLEPSRDK